MIYITVIGDMGHRRAGAEMGLYLGVLVMPAKRNVLETLKAELAFVERGGYRNKPRFPWRPSFVFEDSPTCLNFQASQDWKPCTECLILQFVPKDKAELAFPCRHIPLTPAGESVAHFYECGTERELEAALKGWLKRKIAELENENAGKLA